MKWLDGYRIRLMLIGLVAAIVLSSAASARAALTWKRRADMPTPRFGHSAAVVNGRIYVIGGLASETGFLITEALSAVEEYDPATDTWTRKADMPVARGYFGGSSSPIVDGKIYVIGGGNPASARVDIYDPATDTWSRGADMPTPRLILPKVAWDGKIYAFGGLTGTLGSSTYTRNVTEVYDPKTDTWTEAAPMPVGVWGHSAEVVDDKIYVVGGATSINAHQILQVYDPQTDTWTRATPMPIRTRGLGTSVLCGKIYAVGGWLSSVSIPYSDTWVYDPTTDTWTAAAPLPDARAGLTTSVVNGRIYAIGGSPRGHPTPATSTVYELGLPSPDFNGDGIVDSADISIMVDHWHTEDPRYDIAPVPCGDGIVDVKDLVVLAEYLFQEVDDPTLVAHWALDEAEGDIAYDSAAYNDAVVFGDAVWQPEGGHVNGALQFDGIDDYISVDLMLDRADAKFSVFAWVKGGMPGQVIFSQAATSDWLGADTTNGSLMTELRFLGKSSRPLQSQTIITDGNWHRIGLVWDGSNRFLYADAVEVASDAYDKGWLIGGLQIGAGKNLDAASFFSGLIDDVRIYDRAITP